MSSDHEDTHHHHRVACEHLPAPPCAWRMCRWVPRSLFPLVIGRKDEDLHPPFPRPRCMLAWAHLGRLPRRATSGGGIIASTIATPAMENAPIVAAACIRAWVAGRQERSGVSETMAREVGVWRSVPPACSVGDRPTRIQHE